MTKQYIRFKINIADGTWDFKITSDRICQLIEEIIEKKEIANNDILNMFKEKVVDYYFSPENVVFSNGRLDIKSCRWQDYIPIRFIGCHDIYFDRQNLYINNWLISKDEFIDFENYLYSNNTNKMLQMFFRFNT